MFRAPFAGIARIGGRDHLPEVEGEEEVRGEGLQADDLGRVVEDRRRRGPARRATAPRSASDSHQRSSAGLSGCV